MVERQKSELTSVGDLNGLVYFIRGHYVMLDADIAMLYGYTVKRVNEQAKRNIERFPEDFMFQLTDDEVSSVWSQNATANINKKKVLCHVTFSKAGNRLAADCLLFFALYGWF